ncbi:ABC transporter permease/substrate-binding protein [Maricaulis sp.]|uniref:ABC transporter permease/substrate-binding protein n=1 Tax=Maricaulis sp. TaxID=1486257 RepID=UPI00260D5479|nr:ABC transporter permease/substrate-binding protein [Maricaulis sp.]MDF1769256.1 ABC transporter permease/substrate-binding protein [Maricaulis sp.]
MNANLAERFAELPHLLSGHVLLSMSAILVGLAISLPLGIQAAGRPRLAGLVLNAASIIQTIPGLALLALMVPLLGGTIGYAPAFLALMLYSILPILRNTIVGLQGVDPVVREAARGIGMTPGERLWQVELPLALPVIVAGLRTAVVWVVGAATLATPVGASSLGNYIFAGLQTRNWLSVLFGCLFAAGLAIILDQMIRLLEVAARERRRGLAAGVGLSLAILITASVAPRYIAFEPAGRNSAVIAGGAADLTDETIVVGAKAFTEQYILGALLESRMEAAGARIDRRDNLGSTIAFDALRTGEIDVYIDYSGTIWATVMNRPEPIHRHAMLAEMTGWLWAEHGILALGGLGFENAYGFAMAREQAAALGVTSLADLAPLAAQMTVGGDAEVFSRPEWVMTRDLYGLGAMQTRAMDAAFMYGAVRDGQVDMISAYTTDGRIAAFDLIVLDDPAAVLPPYDAVILLSPDAAANPALVAILAELVGVIDDELMREANRQVDLDRQTPDQAAQWLAETLEAGGADR